eukprot:scaffold54773_cov42-Prasinocladus_malaysianus.AAC.1
MPFLFDTMICSTSALTGKSVLIMRRVMIAVIPGVKKEELKVNGGLGAMGAMSRAQNPEWTSEEVKAVEVALLKYPSDKFQLMERAIRIAATLKNKTARDVALRLKWIHRKDLAKKAKKEAADRNAKNMRRPGSGSIFAVQSAVPGTTTSTPTLAASPSVATSSPEGAIDGGPGGQ